LGFSCGLVELSLCILPAYLGAPYAFLMKFFTYQKKKKSVLSKDSDLNWFVIWRVLVQCQVDIRWVGLVLPLLKNLKLITYVGL
jgi:hypothetical protein